jgi:hypothetical protein
MPPRKKQAAPSAPARRSSRVAANEAAAEAKMHAEALAATKDWFSEMGKEMQIAEDREAAELFAQTVMDHEKKTGLVCVMLDSVEDESDESDDEDDDDDDDDDDEDADEADDSDAEPSEVSGSGSDDDDGSDEDEEEDPLWAPDGMKERLENALKVYVPPNAAETLDSLQLTLRLTEAVPGGGAVLAEKVVDAAVNAIEANDKNDKNADAAFDNAFAATVAMAEADAERTWAHDKKRAAKMIAKLGITWRWLFRIYEKHERANRGEAPRGLRRLEATGVAALETYLDQRCAEKWRAMGLTTNKFYTVAAVAGSWKGKKRARAE